MSDAISLYRLQGAAQMAQRIVEIETEILEIDREREEEALNAASREAEELENVTYAR